MITADESKADDVDQNATDHRHATEPEPHAHLPMGFTAPPHDIEAEQALLGAIMVNNEALEQPAEYLTPEHFYEPVHVSIFDIMLKLRAEERIIDHVTLGSAFQNDSRLADVDGRRYLAGLARAAECILNANDYARLIFDLAQRRFLGGICEQAMNAAMDPTLTLASDWKVIADRVTSSIGEISISEPHDRSWGGGEVVEQLKAKLLLRKSKVSTGYRSLDEALHGGMRLGCIYGLDAPPKSNKTSALSGIQRGALISGVKTHFFSLEQNPTDLALREFCGDTDTPFEWMEDEKNAEAAVAKLDAWYAANPYFQGAQFDHVPGISIDDLLIRMNRSLIDHGTTVFFIDYH